MANHAITVSLGGQAETELATYLVTINMQRTASGLDTYSSLDDWFSDFLKNQTKAWRREYIAEQADLVRQAFIDAGATTRTSVNTTLGL